MLSSSALRGVVHQAEGARVRFAADLDLVEGFCVGAELEVGPSRRRILASEPGGLLELDDGPTLGSGPRGGQIVFPDEAPILAARLATGTPAGESLPEVSLRLATTRGTNALLERRGARVGLFITKGFGDLLEIGTQQRPDLFALAVVKPQPLYSRVIEVTERLAADGSVLTPLDEEALVEAARQAVADGIDCAAVALLHAYRNPAHELAVAARLKAEGLTHVSISSRLAGRPKILPRAETAVVNAYLSPAIEEYLRGVQGAIGEGRLHVMTSAGGLVGARHYKPKDSLLSGPAGGVVGAASSGRASGERHLIAFDMGGTSTDVSRIGEETHYRQMTEVGGARLMAPALAIETVAAGGGSICTFDGEQVGVGPQSAGAEPGPACYGRGGPLTLTDVNLLLGRISPERFAIPLDVDAARATAAELLTQVREATDPDLELDVLLEGLLAVADERMAEAIRRISIRQGYGLDDHALVAFGGAGAQHACSLATLLGVGRVLIPADAGILSALGLGAARLERFAERSLLLPLESAANELDGVFEALERQAVGQVAAEGVTASAIEVARRHVEMRLAGQEATLAVDWDSASDLAGLSAAFEARYVERYGYTPPSGQLEIESVRLVAVASADPIPTLAPPARSTAAVPGHQRAWLAGRWDDWPAYERGSLEPGASFVGPALIWETHSSTVVEDGWHGWIDGAGAIALERSEASA